MSSFPDYYGLLNVPRSASTEEIRQAYKKESLRTHPDRLANATAAERQTATERFQAVADAYYILSDPARRREYDTLYASRSYKETNNDPKSFSNFFTAFSSMFGGTSQAAGGQAAPERPNPDEQFANVFDELLRPEVEHVAPWWSYVGAVCGGGIGFIIANVPGLMLGAVAGNRLGAIRDAKGRSVAAVFAQLTGNQRTEILRALALKVLGSAL